MKKQNTNATTGLLIGLTLGFLIALAMFKATPKSQRSLAFPYAIGLGVIACSVIGFQIGNYTDKENYRNEALGIKNIQTVYKNDGGIWAIESFWREYNGKENKLVTTLLDNEMVSIYNDVVIVNHGYVSNNRSASKIHEEVKTDLIQRLKETFIY